MEKYNYDDIFADKVASLCFDHYAHVIKKTGKPQNNREWTVLACVVAELCVKGSAPDLRVLALGTGSKCLGQNKLDNQGNLIHDSHAEVIARRAFLRFLYRELAHVYHGNVSDYIERCTEEEVKFQIKPGVFFHFFSSQTPCGDAAIFPLTGDPTQCGINDLIGDSVTHDVVNLSKRHHPETDTDGCVPSKLSRQEAACQCKLLKSSEGVIVDLLNSGASTNSDQSKMADCCMGQTERDKITTDTHLPVDTHRTGAKCVTGEKQDPHLPGVAYHVTGVLRTKPGRGDQTLSMSCSDKLSLWNVVGIQGALLSILIKEPIYLQTITIGKCLFNMDAIRRAILVRTELISDLPIPYHHHNVVVLQASRTFEHSRELAEEKAEGKKTGPSPASVIWWLDGTTGQQEASVNGRKQGVISKNWNKPVARCSICPYELFKQFSNLTKNMTDEMKEQINLLPVSETYLDYKACAIKYQQAKKAVLKLFNTWKRMPHQYYKFTITD